MQNIARYIIVLLLLVGCDTGLFKTGNTSMEGCFGEYSGQTVVINEIGVRSFTPLDTLKLNSLGCFDYSLELETPGIYLIKLNQQNYITVVLEPGEEIKVESPSAEIRYGYSVMGSSGSEALRRFEMVHRNSISSLDSLAGIMQGKRFTNVTYGMKEVEIQKDSMINAYKDQVVDLVSDHSGSLASLIMLNRRLDVFKVFDEMEDYGVFNLVDSVLMLKYPENKHVKDHHFKMEQTRYRMEVEAYANERLAPGKKAPDISLEQPGGQEVSLSSLEGRPVIIYFWASNDARSRQANARMMQIYKEFSGSGLEILAVSLDSYEEMWKAAIQAHGLNWLNVSDLMGRGSPVAIRYHIPEDLPFMYLIDRSGNIVKRSDDPDDIKESLPRIL